MTRFQRRRCDICERNYASGGHRDGDRTWWLCARCFNKADIMSFHEDRSLMPNETHYEKLRAKKLARAR